MQRGMTPRQADHTLARGTEAHVLASRYTKAVVCFGILMVFISLTMFGLWIWLVVAFAEAEEEAGGHHKDCDVPLWVWTAVVIGLWAFKTAKWMFDRLVCCWHATETNSRPPWRVVAKDVLVMLFEFVWVVVMGWVWISEDGSGGGPACEAVTPNLYRAAKVYIAFNTAALVFTWVSSFGLLAVLRCLMRGGLLRSRDAAPPEAIEKNTEVVELTEAQLAETPACAICSADFGAGGAPVAKAAACGHVFHKPCLQKWMAMARSCPLCRQDLAQGA